MRPKELYKECQLPGIRQIANEAKANKFGVEAQADELIAQIALAEQAGALSLYEEALAALRTGDNARARSRLAEVAAAGDSLDDGLRAKVENLLQKLSTDEKAKTADKSGTNAAQDAEAKLGGKKLNAEVGTKIAEDAVSTTSIPRRRSRFTRRPSRPFRLRGSRPICRVR